MKHDSAPTLVRFILLTLIFTGSVSATPFPICYAECIVLCAIFESIIPCALQCLVKCYLFNQSVSQKMYYQNLGCAINKCAKFGNDTKNVFGCVTGCEKLTMTI
ncbi:hypothetical protein ABFS82_05G057500 [Erythranthe guttata]